jgi:hypothetical protein
VRTINANIMTFQAEIEEIVGDKIAQVVSSVVEIAKRPSRKRRQLYSCRKERSLLIHYESLVSIYMEGTGLNFIFNPVPFFR